MRKKRKCTGGAGAAGRPKFPADRAKRRTQLRTEKRGLLKMSRRQWTHFVGLFAAVQVCRCLDCFKCVSLDGNNPACEDPFHHNYTSDVLAAPCLAGRKSRNGLFPATACIKLNGVYEETGQTMIVRSCALDSGTLTVDTEIVRMSHCGGFYFEDRYMKGCLQSCFEDACNAAARFTPIHRHPVASAVFLLVGSTWTTLRQMSL